jgi:hypothetical protein
MSEVERLCKIGAYPECWDRPYTPPDSLKEPLRSAFIAACERTLQMPPEQKQAMFEAQRESFIRAMAPCEHGNLDWETCPHCLTKFEKGPTND